MANISDEYKRMKDDHDKENSESLYSEEVVEEEEETMDVMDRMGTTMEFYGDDEYY